MSGAMPMMAGMRARLRRQAGSGRLAAPALLIPRLVLLPLLVMLAACDGDPREMGITGPFPDGVMDSTLSRHRARQDASEEVSGGAHDPVSSYQYVPALRPTATVGGNGPRYYGYNY